MSETKTITKFMDVQKVVKVPIKRSFSLISTSTPIKFLVLRNHQFKSNTELEGTLKCLTVVSF